MRHWFFWVAPALLLLLLPTRARGQTAAKAIVEGNVFNSATHAANSRPAFPRVRR
jgi:hypothetical protein